MVTAVTVTMSSDIAAKDCLFSSLRQKRAKDLRQLKRYVQLPQAIKSPVSPAVRCATLRPTAKSLGLHATWRYLGLWACLDRRERQCSHPTWSQAADGHPVPLPLSWVSNNSSSSFLYDFLSALDVETASGFGHAAALEVEDRFIIHHLSFII